LAEKALLAEVHWHKDLGVPAPAARIEHRGQRAEEVKLAVVGSDSTAVGEVSPEVEQPVDSEVEGGEERLRTTAVECNVQRVVVLM
jgi:hypothetical protein